MTGLRIVAAVWVVAFHFHFTALPGVADVSALLGPLVTQGSLGVDLFFVLSGFVIAYTYLDVLGPRLRLRAAGRFVWARAGRMWPAYVLVFNLFGIWMVARSVLGSDPAEVAFQAVQPTLSWGEWLQQVFLVQMWTQPFLDGASWVGPTWSISAEWLAYLLFPVTALVFFRLRRLPFAVLALGAVGLMSPMVVSFAVLGSPYYPFSWLVRILCGFSAGVLALLAVRRLRTESSVSGTSIDTARRTRRVASVLAAVAIGGIVAGLVASIALGAVAVGAVTVLFPVLVGSLALADRGPARLLATRPMVHGGRISYALYLVHIPMFEVFWLALRRYDAAGSMTAHLVALAVLVATIPAAHLLFTLVEQPARRRLRDLPGARRRAAVESVPEVEPRPSSAERWDSERARLDPETTLLPRLSTEPVDSARARLDPPTTRLPRQQRPRRTGGDHPGSRVPAGPAELPRQYDPSRDAPHPALDGPVPARELDTARPVDTAQRVVARLHAARDAGHGDDREGDRLAGNLRSAARLRSTPEKGLFEPSARADRVRAVQERAVAGVPEPTASEISQPGHSGPGLPAQEPSDPETPGPDGPDPSGPELPVRDRTARSRPDSGDAGEQEGGAVLTADAGDTRAVPGPRPEGTGSRTGVERCGRSRGRHSAHDSAATPIVATAAASVRGGNPMRRRRRPTHGLHHRGG